MSIINVEVHEAELRMEELIDTVVVGGEVVMTYCGEPVASVYLHHSPPDASQDRLRAIVVDVIAETLKHLRGRLGPPEWLRN